MTQLTHGKIKLFGLFAARLAALASPFVIFLALPPFYAGYWVQVEGAMPWLHAVSAVAASGCAAAALGGDLAARSALGHPLVLIPAGVALVSFILLPFTTLPALSLLGTPEHGFGALAYLDLAALTAAALLTSRTPGWRRAMVCVALAVVAAAFWLDFRFRAERTLAPFFFGDYLAFYAVFVALMLAPYLTIHRFAWIGAVMLLVLLALLSDNKALLLSIAIGAAVVLVAWRTISSRSAGALSVVLPIAVTAAVLIVGSLWQEETRELLRHRPGGPQISALWASLWSRAMLVIVGAQSLIDQPMRLLVGIGWGHYNEALLADLPLVKGRLHELIGHSRVYWDALERSDFHSHNQYFEALLSAGLAGLVLVLAYNVAMVLSAPATGRRYMVFIVVVLGALQCLWFQMPHTLPVMAIAVAMAAAAPSAAAVPSYRLLAVVAGGAGIVLAASGVWAWSVSHRAYAALRDVRSQAQPTQVALSGLSEIYRASLLQAAYARARREDGHALAVLNAHLIAAVAEGEIKSRRLAVTVLNVISGLIFTLPRYQDQYGSLDIEYRSAVNRLLAKAPRRTDLAIPYFNYLLAAGREREAFTLAEAIRSRSPEDIVALWFSGIVLLADQRTSTEGVRRLRQSLAQGIGEQMPISKEIRDSIQNIQ